MALTCHGAVRGPAGEPEAEGQRPGVGGDEVTGGGLGDDARLPGVPATQGGERPGAAVLLTAHEVHGERPAEGEADRLQRAHGCEDRRHPALHVGDAAAAKPHAVLVLAADQGPRVVLGPELGVGGGHGLELLDGAVRDCVDSAQRRARTLERPHSECFANQDDE